MSGRFIDLLLRKPVELVVHELEGGGAEDKEDSDEDTVNVVPLPLGQATKIININQLNQLNKLNQLNTLNLST